MGYWNYRIFEKEDRFGDKYYQLHEVHYHNGPKNEKNDLYPKFYSAEPRAHYGETPDELKDALEKSLEAFKKPIINEKELETYFKTKSEKGLTAFYPSIE